MAAVEPRPAGFPRCQRCAYRTRRRPAVCLGCLDAAGLALPGEAGRVCAACGQLRPGGDACTNRWCTRADRGWSVVWAVGVHAGPLRRVIVDYKYRRRQQWGPVLARLVAGWLMAHATWVEEFDLLVPVPAWTGAGARRSWDAVGALAATVGELTGPSWDVAPGVVRKTGETPPMAGRPRHERLAIAEGPLRAALAVPDRQRVAGARVLLLDDVLTGGGTLREVARALRAAGAEEVAGLVVARPAWLGDAAPDRPGRP